MVATPEVVKDKVPSLTTNPSELKEPKSVQIVLLVCGCYRNETLTLVTEKANRVASILGVTLQQLECFAVTTMFTGKPEVVACYKQWDVAEAKLLQLQAATPFISRPCHSFELGLGS